MGFFFKRLNAHAHDIEVALPLLDHAADTFPRDAMPQFNDMDGPLVAEIADWGRGLASRLRNESDLPDLKELHDWQRCAKSIVAVLKATSPDVVSEYEKSLDSKKDRRLIRSL